MCTSVPFTLSVTQTPPAPTATSWALPEIGIFTSTFPVWGLTRETLVGRFLAISDWFVTQTAP